MALFTCFECLNFYENYFIQLMPFDRNDTVDIFIIIDYERHFWNKQTCKNAVKSIKIS